jgi:hypothetical protein
MNWDTRNSEVATMHFLTTLMHKSSRGFSVKLEKLNQSQGLVFSTTVSKVLTNQPRVHESIHLLVTI